MAEFCTHEDETSGSTETEFLENAILWGVTPWHTGSNILKEPDASIVGEEEAGGSTKMLVQVYQTTQHHIPANCNLNIHCQENRKTSCAHPEDGGRTAEFPL
jgi:hypothetical protein